MHKIQLDTRSDQRCSACDSCWNRNSSMWFHWRKSSIPPCMLKATTDNNRNKTVRHGRRSWETAIRCQCQWKMSRKLPLNHTWQMAVTPVSHVYTSNKRGQSMNLAEDTYDCNSWFHLYSQHKFLLGTQQHTSYCTNWSQASILSIDCPNKHYSSPQNKLTKKKWDPRNQSPISESSFEARLTGIHLHGISIHLLRQFILCFVMLMSRWDEERAQRERKENPKPAHLSLRTKEQKNKKENTENKTKKRFGSWSVTTVASEERVRTFGSFTFYLRLLGSIAVDFSNLPHNLSLRAVAILFWLACLTQNLTWGLDLSFCILNLFVSWVLFSGFFVCFEFSQKRFF